MSDLFKPNGCRTRQGRYKQFNIVCNRQSCNNPGKHWVYSLLDKALALIMKTLGSLPLLLFLFFGAELKACVCLFADSSAGLDGRAAPNPV